MSFPPFVGKLIARIREALPGFAVARRFAFLEIGLPGDLFEPRDGFAASNAGSKKGR